MRQILIIGGSSGIGLGLVNHLSKDNRIYATYNTNPKSSTENVNYLPFNVLTEPLQTDALPEILDGFVYCPGSILLKPWSRFSEEEILNDYRLQVVGFLKCLSIISLKLKRSSNPSIVLFSSIAASMGMPFHAMVSSTKSAIEGMTRSLAAELSPSIRINCIAPSLTDTPLATNLLNTDEKRLISDAKHPMKRIGKVEDIVSMAEFLLSEKSTWITGQILHVDGGMSAIK